MIPQYLFKQRHFLNFRCAVCTEPDKINAAAKSGSVKGNIKGACTVACIVYQRGNFSAQHIVNRNFNRSLLGNLVSYGCCRVEGIWIIWQKIKLFRDGTKRIFTSRKENFTACRFNFLRCINSEFTRCEEKI